MENTTNTQKNKILNFLLEGLKITPMIAASSKFNCTKLTNRISELEAQYDMKFNRQWITEINKDGNRSTYMSYHLTSSQIERINKSKSKQ